MTGHIIGLDLSSEGINGGINDSSTLFSLSFLQSLNLANNYVYYVQIPPSFDNLTNIIPSSFANLTNVIPPSFGNLTNLSYLNLSNSIFGGQIPIELSKLKKLVSLDLSALYFPETDSLGLRNPNLSTLLQNLTSLTELYLDGVDISAPGTEWCNAISSSLPNLQVLSMASCNLSGPIDSSLQNLRFLSEIYLEFNDFFAPLPEFLANFSNLTILTLSSCNLLGTFPSKIFQLPTLCVLELEDNPFLQGSLPELPKNGLLQHLILQETNFSGRLPDSIGNLKNLSELDLSESQFSGPIPNSLSNLTQLVYLDLHLNMFTGPIPSFQMSRNLIVIDLSHNSLTGSVPSTHFEGLSKLEFIDLSYNSLNGNIPSCLFFLSSLQQIILSNNQFNRKIAESTNKSLSPLDTLDISNNKLQGEIPHFLFEFPGLGFLNLSFNNFNGSVKLEIIQNLKYLTGLDLSYNNLSIHVGDGHSNSSSFPQIYILNLASCKLKNFTALMNQTRMEYLDLSDNQISGKIPKWIWNIGNGSLFSLNLSCNLLEEIERPFVNRGLAVIDLHSKKLSGEIPIPSESPIYMDYSSNYFNSFGHNITIDTYFSVSNSHLTGIIPQFICSAISLEVLDLSNNRFDSTIPPCLIENRTKRLGVLDLHNNRFYGKIMSKFPESCTLETFDLNGNLLEGPIPKSLANCKILKVLDLGKNQIDDDFPCFLNNLSSLRVLILHSNKFKGGIHCGDNINITWPMLQIMDLALNNFSGDIPSEFFLGWKEMASNKIDLYHLRFDTHKGGWSYQDRVIVTNKGMETELLKILTIYTLIDFSSNKFEGEIPDTIGALKSLCFLNLSHNGLTGQIPSSLGDLKLLESLDLSQNNLNGSIPQQLAGLSFMSDLNLSYNHLVGMIPKGNQFQTFSETSFQGNPRLCGTPLNKSCLKKDSDIPTNSSSNQSKIDFFHWQFVYTALAGFVIGAWFVVGSLIFWKTGSKWCDNALRSLVG